MNVIQLSHSSGFCAGVGGAQCGSTALDCPERAIGCEGDKLGMKVVTCVCTGGWHRNAIIFTENLICLDTP